jgi:hypothetical protein
MSSRSYSYLAAVALLFAGLGVAHAQQAVTAKIPFDFVASGQTLPAGTYVFREALPNNNQTLAILDGRGHGVVAGANNLDWQETGQKLVFHKYGEQYFLADVYSPTGRLHFTESRSESKLAKSAELQSVSIAVGD